MKTLITYYSFSGHTDNVANIFAGKLKAKGQVVLQRLKPSDEITTFGAQCRAAFTGRRAALGPEVNYDVSSYDLVVIACPVWAFAPVPAINTYLDKISGLNGKRVAILLTSGSGLGVNRCFKAIEKVLRHKGAVSIDEINVPDRIQGDRSLIESRVEKLL
ncbi:MAG: NAD(P)H-dependent oxidoreductase [Candidatus Omnitrophica bacterium]|nr:NAD(P)H-dependent oxidoreductase [Candidatus Omnitrophota bacterium]